MAPGYKRRFPLASSRFYLIVELHAPFLALGQHVFLGVLEGFVLVLALQDVAGLAGGDEVIHASGAAPRVGMDMVNRHDQPVLKTVQTVQAAILTLEMVTFENLHGFLARKVRGGSEKESGDVF